MKIDIYILESSCWSKKAYLCSCVFTRFEFEINDQILELSTFKFKNLLGKNFFQSRKNLSPTDLSLL